MEIYGCKQVVNIAWISLISAVDGIKNKRKFAMCIIFVDQPTDRATYRAAAGPSHTVKSQNEKNIYCNCWMWMDDFKCLHTKPKRLQKPCEDENA